MSVPVSKYEELLLTVRQLKQQTIRVRALATPLLDTIVTANERLNTRSWATSTLTTSTQHDLNDDLNCGLDMMDPLILKSPTYEEAPHGETPHYRDPRLGGSVSSEPDPERNVSVLYHGTWPVERGAMWNSEPPNLSQNIEVTSVMSFASSSGAAPLDRVLNEPRGRSQHLEVKVDMVYSLLSMLGTQDCPDMGETLLALSSSPDSSLAMRQAGCLPVLVQLVYSDKDRETREKASKALYNLIQVQPDDKLRKREVKVIKLLEDIRSYCDLVNDSHNKPDTREKLMEHPTQVTENIIKLSFDEGYRQTICELGGIYSLAHLVEADHLAHKSLPENEQCVLIRRYAGMALTNLTFGHSQNKALLCSFRDFMRCLVEQLASDSDELRQVTASVIRNLSWRADASSRLILREVGSVPALMSAAIISRKESTLKSILSALWNLSAHCSMNKADICAVEGSLGFLVDMLSYKPPSKTLAIIENAGGILRNISSHVAVREDYRAVLRKHNCLQVLLQQLKSPSLTIVSNACGTLWNLSAKCVEDQKALWDLGAAPMLRSLNHSKHIMIATGSRAALKNLLSSRPGHNLCQHVDSTAKELGLPALPTLGARKQRALAKDLDNNLSETFENIEPTSPLDAKRRFKYDKSPEEVTENFGNLSLNDDYRKQYSPNGYNINQRILRPKYSDRFDDDLENCDQPVDYSVKYSESKMKVQTEPIDYSTKSYVKTDFETPIDYSKKYETKEEFSKKYDEQTQEFQPVDYSKKTGTLPKYTDFEKYEKPNFKTENNSFTDYAETDLDQPTNYSLRYAENDSDSEDICKPQRFYEEHDQVKTYCTEGTPYQTPYNFSTATSLSDLRAEQVENVKKEPEKTEKVYGSGVMSPEKPVNYAEEGTPGYFSRVSSLSSLNATGGETESDKKEEEAIIESPQKNEEQIEENKDTKDREAGKVVTFGRVVDYAEETPLMFSRCSSLGSLSSAEQHSIHDDRSSVSDFSRLTSGVISPSEIPDSPTQTIPPSPRQRKAPEFPTPVEVPQPVQPKSVFEDNVVKYKEVNTPVEFSTNTSLSSLTIDDEPSVPTKLKLLQNGSIERTDLKETEEGAVKTETKETTNENASAELSTVSEGEEEGDDDMLAQCINIGMQNNRIRQEKSPQKFNLPSALPKYLPKTPRTSIPVKLNSRLPVPDKKSEPSQDTIKTYCTEDTPAMLSQAGSNSDLSVLSIKDEKTYEEKQFSDDSSNLSGDNDNILAECIQSGMPKARKQIVPPKVKPVRKNLTQKMCKNEFYEASDELESFAVEDSPCHFSLRSSLSDLTVDGGVAGLAKTVETFEKKEFYARYENYVGSSKEKCKAGPSVNKEPIYNEPNEDQQNLSRHASLSSLSVESYGSTENAEQALLEQCISSGMPKSQQKTETKPKPAARNEKSKNEFATSAVTSTPQPSPSEINRTADVENIENNVEHAERIMNNGFENLDTYTEKNEYDINKCSDVLTDCSIEDNISPDNSDSEIKSKIKNRMLDPDAMIESLDRFTAELVSHSAHLNSHECKPMNQSDGDTWNEDTSPNDISFPSISISAPLVASFKSETDSKLSADVVDGKSDTQENQFSSVTMTESTIIQMEANKLFNVVHNEMHHSINSLDLDHVNPPSLLESIISLTSSISEIKNSPKNSPLPRKKLSGVMVRRALGNTNQKSIDMNESISSSCNIEHIKPPSVMGDYLDMVDMESSMVSVSSIMSEVAEPLKSNGPITQHEKIWSIKTEDVTQIENINPPSLLNEITDMCNSTADIVTENVYNSTTEVFEDCFTHTMDQTLQPGDTFTADEVTEYSDACSVTPVQSDFGTSSAESTPKKVKNVNKRLTPKQRRQLAKERYKTYTVAAELVMRESKSPIEIISESPDFATANTESLDFVTITSSPESPSSPKITPKERRLMDRERFQTRVLERSPEITMENKFATFDRKTKKIEQPECSTTERIIIRRPAESLQMNLTKLDIEAANKLVNSDTESESPQRSIPKPIRSTVTSSPNRSPRTKTDIRKAMQQKRLENKERFRTRTLSSDNSSPEVSPAPGRRTLTSEELHTMLEQETTIILNTLEQNTSNVDDFLEYETLSLVSNDEDSESNSVTSVNYRTYHKSWSFNRNLPIVKNETKNLNTETENEDTPKVVKPKIIKPNETFTQEPPEEADEQTKAVRGKKKVYVSPYRSPVAKTKPIKTVTSNLVKNVTSTLTKAIPKTSPGPSSPQKSLKPPSGLPKTQNRTSLPKMSPQKGVKRQSLPVKIERQGTFVKEEREPEPTTSTTIEKSQSTSKLPTSKISEKTSRIARAIVGGKSKTAPSLKPPQKIQNKTVTSTTKKVESRSVFYSRSPSADRDKKITNSSSSQSLQNQELRKKSSIPSLSTRSNSNVSIGSSESNGKKKQVTSKIASLWKKVEESKKKQPEKDNKKWITPNCTSEVDSTIVGC